MLKNLTVFKAVLPRSMRILSKKITFIKILNIMLNKTSYSLSNMLKKTIIWGYPQSMMIEPTNSCNLRCPLCAYGANNITRQRSQLDIETFKYVIDELYPYLFTIQLWNQGEPFLNKNFLKLAKYASQKGIYTITSTNCHYLKNPKEIIESGLDELILSIDGATAETYVKYRIGGDFNQIISDIKKLVKTKKELNIKKPYLTFQFVITRQNEHEVKAAEELARNLGVNEIIYKTAEIPPGNEACEYAPLNPEYRRYGDIDPNDWIHKRENKNCSDLWTRPVLNADGKLAACCFDKDNDFQLPKLKHYASFKEFWRGTKMREIREKVRLHNSKITPCKYCTENLIRNYKSIKF